MDRKKHWNDAYAAKSSTELSWYESFPIRSLELLIQAGAGPESEIIDVGGGDSTLVDTIVTRDLGHVTVLDLSRTALERAQARLGSRASDVTWIEADITTATLPRQSYDFWHDRAVFHFLTDLTDRRRYVAAAAAALRPYGILIVATFASDGPTRCSGLEVARYSHEQLAVAFGTEFRLLRDFASVHLTPSGAEQRFTHAVFERCPDHAL